MDKTEKKNKIRKIVFIILEIVSLIASIWVGKAALSVGTFTAVDLVLSIIGTKSACDGTLLESFENSNSSTISQPQGDSVYFLENIFLCQADGYNYSIAKMADRDNAYRDTGDYVVLKSTPGFPEVDFFVPSMPETQPGGEYLISSNLPEEDFSDLIDDEFINSHEEIFEDRTDFVFTVIDLNNDVLKTAKETEQERTENFNKGMGLVITLVGVFYLSAFGLVLAIPLGIITLFLTLTALILFFLFFLFLNLSLKINKNEKSAENTN